jgi:integrase/recombinase XerD
MGTWLEQYLSWLLERNYSPRTTAQWRKTLAYFFEWCEARSVTRPEEVRLQILEGYQRHLFHARKKSGRPLSFVTQKSRLLAVRGYFRWLVREHVIASSPASELVLPRVEKRLPQHVLTAEEAERVLSQPNTEERLGLRDRAILEMLYATGMRRMELVGLSVFDIDFERATVLVREGKGKKDRLLPIGARALGWVEKYLQEVRAAWLLEPGETRLFLTQWGEVLKTNHLTRLVREYVAEAALESGKKGSCHLFRHSMATLMLEGGADVRFVQEMLGHASLETTQLYTQVSIRKLVEVHAASHPGMQTQRTPKPEPADDARDALLTALASEDDDGDDA